MVIQFGILMAYVLVGFFANDVVSSTLRQKGYKTLDDRDAQEAVIVVFWAPVALWFTVREILDPPRGPTR